MAFVGGLLPPVIDNGLGSSVATTPYAEITMPVVDLIRRWLLVKLSIEPECKIFFRIVGSIHETFVTF